jgi:hypothetical protein
LVEDPADAAPQEGRFDPSLLLVFAGIGLVFLAFLSAAFWKPGYAIYFLGGGIVLLAIGFVVASKSG